MRWEDMWQCEARLLYEAKRRALGTKDMVNFFFQFVSSPIVWFLAAKQNLSQPKLNLLLLWSRSPEVDEQWIGKGSSWHALRARNTHLLLTGFDLLHHAKFSFVLSVDWPSTECWPITDRYIGQVSTNYRRSVGEVSAKCRRRVGEKSGKCRWTKSYIGRDTSGTTTVRVSTACPPTIDRLSTAISTNCRPSVNRVLTECRPSVDRLSTECWPQYRSLYRPISRSTLPTVSKIPSSLSISIPKYITILHLNNSGAPAREERAAEHHG